MHRMVSGEVGPAENSAPRRSRPPENSAPSDGELGPINRRTRPPAAGELGPLAGELGPTVWQSDMALHCYVLIFYFSFDPD